MHTKAILKADEGGEHAETVDIERLMNFACLQTSPQTTTKNSFADLPRSENDADEEEEPDDTIYPVGDANLMLHNAWALKYPNIA